MELSDGAAAQAVVNGVLYIVQFEPELDGAIVERTAVQIETRPLFGQPVAVTAAALRTALANTGELGGQIPQPHDEPTCRRFLTKLAQRLDLSGHPGGDAEGQLSPLSDESQQSGVTPAGALEHAQRLLAAYPPAAAQVRPVEPVLDRGWCFVIFWTLANSDDAPPPGVGPIIVWKNTATASYLGSLELEHELELARNTRLDRLQPQWPPLA